MIDKNPLGKLAEAVGRWTAIACGWGVLALALGVTVEIVGRKLFGFSFHGIDDIGGYVLAVTATVGASYTMARRGHTRIDVLLVRMPRALQGFLNALAMVSLALFALFALWRGSSVLEQSIELKSVATNPLQTPLWQPQSLWLLGLGLFAVFATAYAVHAVALWLRGSPQLNRFYGPTSAVEELEAELEARREKP